jgi:hypothetical protein
LSKFEPPGLQRVEIVRSVTALGAPFLCLRRSKHSVTPDNGMLRPKPSEGGTLKKILLQTISFFGILLGEQSGFCVADMR